MKRLVVLFLVMVMILPNICKADKQNKAVIAYVFVTDRLVDPDAIDAERLTHINYAFADIRDGVIAEGFKHDAENFKLLNSLKTKNPELKILVSIGGWTWSGNFSDMVLTAKSRKKFIDSTIEFAKKHELDGIDIDWEYPGLVGIGNTYRTEDKENFVLFLKELREALNKLGKENGKYYLETIAAGAFDEFIEVNDMGAASKYLDYVNLMTYDFCEAEVDSMSSHHTCLYTNPKAPKTYSADHAVKIFHEAGVPYEKIVLGCAFYGRAWGNVDAENGGLFQIGEPVKIWASYQMIRTKYEQDKNWTRYWDDVAKAPYFYNKEKKIFITYDDTESIQLKCDYINENKLGGVMFWEYHGDYNNEMLKVMSKSLLNK